MYVFWYVYNLLNFRMILDNVSVYVAPFAIFLILSFSMFRISSFSYTLRERLICFI